MKRLLVCAVPLLLGACYSYVRVPATTVPEGARTTVALTSQGSLDVQPALGPNVEELQGTFIRSTPDSLELFVTSVTRRGNERMLVSTPLVLSSAAYSQVRERRFNALRTAGATLGVVAAVWIGIATDFFGVGQDRDSGDPPCPPPCDNPN
jgi:hypothetical protein